MKLSRGCCYVYRRDKPYRESQQKADFAARIRECFYFHRRRYGSRRNDAALEIGRFRAHSVMKREELKTKQNSYCFHFQKASTTPAIRANISSR